MIVGVLMVRDEADIIESTLRHHIGQGVEHVVVADNGSVDGTRDLLDALAAVLPLTVLEDAEVGYYQSRKITTLVHEHCGPGDWIVPFDADEHWFADPGLLADELRGTAADVLICPVYDRLPDGRLANVPEQYPVVCARYCPALVIAQGAHSAMHPGVHTTEHLVRVTHYQWRSYEQFVRKVRNGRQAYEATNLPPGDGAHWRTLGALSDDELRERWEQMCLSPPA